MKRQDAKSAWIYTNGIKQVLRDYTKKLTRIYPNYLKMPIQRSARMSDQGTTGR